MRRTLTLIEHLPPESAYKRAQRGSGWSELEELVALVGHVGHEGVRVSVAATGAKRSKIPKPLELDSPVERLEKAKPKPTLTRQAIRQRLLHPVPGR